MSYIIRDFGWNDNFMMTYVKVGPYDDQVMPAVMLFHDESSHCAYSASRHYYNPAVKNPGEFDYSDFYGNGNFRMDW